MPDIESANRQYEDLWDVINADEAEFRRFILRGLIGVLEGGLMMTQLQTEVTKSRIRAEVSQKVLQNIADSTTGL